MSSNNPLQAWLTSVGLERHWQVLVDNDVDLELVTELGNDDLRELGLSLGDRKRFLRAAALRATPPPVSQTSAASWAHPSAATPAQASTPADDSPSARSDSLGNAHRRQLTVMFCDLVGSTRLSEQMDPEDLRYMTRDYQNLCTGVVQGFGGSIARLLGDGVLVYLGFPVAHEDDAERAILAALSIIQRLPEISIPDNIDPLQVRIGIATGPVVVADLDINDVFSQGDVFGETPNLAARLQGLAEPDSVVISSRTHQLALGCFEYDNLGHHDLKGFSEPVNAWRVAASRRAGTRFESGRYGRLTSLVGRVGEEEYLLKRWQRSCDGEGQIVVIRGEAGIGKSRLARGLCDRIKAQQRYQLLNQCTPYNIHSPLFPIIAELERISDIQPQDSDAERITKLQKLEALRDPNQGDALAIISTLLSIDYPDDGVAALGPTHLKARTLEVLLERIVYLSSISPVLYLIEDAHWIDPSSQELISRLIPLVAEHRIMLVLTARPEFTPGWEPQPHLNDLNLERLDQDHGRAMVRQLSNQRELPPEVCARILQRADGNPLFVEEITRLVLESDLLEKRDNRYLLRGNLAQLAIPDTLHDSLMARIDRLSIAREIAQVGATLGREFSYSLISEVSDLSAERLTDGLDRLVQANLLYRRSNAADGSYMFKHALVQEAAYQSLLKSRRQQLHALAVAAYERRAHQPDSAALAPELLAYHCTGACQYDRAIPYWQQAADSALAQSAYNEAIGHLNAGLPLTSELPAGDRRDTLELKLLLSLGIALTATHGYGVPEVRESYARAAVLARRVGQSDKLFPALYGLWWGTLLRADYEHSKDLARELLAQANASGIDAFKISAHRALGATLFYTGDFVEALEQQEQGLAIPKTASNRSQAMEFDVVDPWVTCGSYRAGTLWMLGRVKESQQQLQQSISTARELNHPFTLALTLGIGCWISQFSNDREHTRRYANEAIDISREHGFPFWSGWGTILRAWATGDEVDHDTRIGTMNRGLKDWQGSGTETGLVYFRALLADAHFRRGDCQHALSMLSEAQQGAERLQELWWTAEMSRLRGDILLGLTPPQPEQAAAAYQQAFDAARQQHSHTLGLRAAVSLAQLLIDQGSHEQARSMLVQAMSNEVDSGSELQAARQLLAAIPAAS